MLRDASASFAPAGFTPFAIFAEIQLARSAINRGDVAHALESLTRIGAEAASVDYAGSCSSAASTSPMREDRPARRRRDRGSRCGCRRRRR